MSKSQTVTITEDSTGKKVASTKDAEILDVITTMFSTNSAVVGMLGLAQRGLLFGGGMLVNNKMKTGSFNILK